ncbi:hypothetical protein [Flavobacterium hydrophilum]|uniref:hypothetical protein n=1 Tax=Flavobacterium hydrophilum TaxID=2211445 RepID=UPI001401C112|nr:hypothetical protein [Flavobacterium hydrophilum]
MASFIFLSTNFFENESETTKLISLTGRGSLKGLNRPEAAKSGLFKYADFGSPCKSVLRLKLQYI